jgi:hypothetical protein
VEDSLDYGNVKVGHFEYFPLLVRTEPESSLDCDRPNSAADDRETGVVCGYRVGIGSVDYAAGVVYGHELRTLDFPEGAAIRLRKVAVEIEPPGE